MGLSKRKFARYPLCFGKLDCQGIFDVAVKHGMEVISCRKPDMHVCNEVGLFGTTAQMKLVEKEWEAAGNKLERRAKPPLVFGVNLDVPQDQWASVKLRLEKASLLPINGSKIRAELNHVVAQVIIPHGWRVLKRNELPFAKDFAYNRHLEGFTPVMQKDLDYYGQEGYKKHSYLVIRKK